MNKLRYLLVKVQNKLMNVVNSNAITLFTLSGKVVNDNNNGVWV